MIIEKAARGLGWASIGIGLTEISAPKRLERMMGVGNGQNTGILRVLGVREVLHGVDILSHRDAGPGVWSRVAGDVLDVAVLGAAARKTWRPGGLGAVFGMVMGIGILDMLLARALRRRRREG